MGTPGGVQVKTDEPGPSSWAPAQSVRLCVPAVPLHIHSHLPSPVPVLLVSDPSAMASHGMITPLSRSGVKIWEGWQIWRCWDE